MKNHHYLTLENGTYENHIRERPFVDKRYKNPSPQIAVRFEPAILEKMRKIAKRDNISVARVIRKAVAVGLAVTHD